MIIKLEFNEKAAYNVLEFGKRVRGHEALSRNHQRDTEYFYLNAIMSILSIKSKDFYRSSDVSPYFMKNTFGTDSRTGNVSVYMNVDDDVALRYKYNYRALSSEITKYLSSWLGDTNGCVSAQIIRKAAEKTSCSQRTEPQAQGSASIALRIFGYIASCLGLSVKEQSRSFSQTKTRGLALSY